MNIYVGNLAYEASESDLETEFSAFGKVSSVKVVRDRDTGRSRGFAFVEMADDNEGKAAIDGMNGKSVSGRNLVVNEAKPREDRRPSGGNFRQRREY
ncbi:MAG: RNA-binding protein [Leptospiraceae bacterium]|nr:RNA-binding protein [Leptospiraceae bacterium]MCB1201679.1 RNA-binding protein [Leptospiraceae bacterium]